MILFPFFLLPAYGSMCNFTCILHTMSIFHFLACIVHRSYVIIFHVIFFLLLLCYCFLVSCVIFVWMRTNKIAWKYGRFAWKTAKNLLNVNVIRFFFSWISTNWEKAENQRFRLHIQYNVIQGHIARHNMK